MMAPKNLLIPRLWIAKGFLVEGNWVHNVDASQVGLNLIKNWFAERKLLLPYASIWNFDRGKPVILSVIIKYNLLVTVEKGHNQATKLVRRIRSELGKIRTLSGILSFSKEFFKKAYFNAREVETCRTLCRVLEKRVKKISYP